MSGHEIVGWLSLAGWVSWAIYMVATSKEDHPVWKDAMFLALWAGVLWGFYA